MQFKELEWKVIVSDGIVVCSNCRINLCGVINMEFKINHEPKENKYILYSFDKGSLRRLQSDTYDSLKEAKNAAYRIYNDEMAEIKKAVDYLLVT